MGNTSALWQQAAHTTYQHPAAQQEPYKKAKPLILEKSQDNGPLAEKWQDRKRTRQKQERR